MELETTTKVPVERLRLDRMTSRKRRTCVSQHGGVQGGQPVVRTRNPDIKRLGEVLVNAEGTPCAGAGARPGHRAREHGVRRHAVHRVAIRDAAGSLRAYDGQDQSLLDIADDIKETADMCIPAWPSVPRKWAAGRSAVSPVPRSGR